MNNEIKIIKAKTTANLRTALSIISKTKDIGTYTLTELKIQNEQIHAIDTKIYDIHLHNKKASNLLREISSVWGTIQNVFTRRPNPPSISSIDTTITKSQSIHIQAAHETNEQEDLAIIEQISHEVKHIGEIGFAIKSELESQNKLLDSLNVKTDIITDKIIRNTKEAKRLT